jgi:hypothetical protein
MLRVSHVLFERSPIACLAFVVVASGSTGCVTELEPPPPPPIGRSDGEVVAAADLEAEAEGDEILGPEGIDARACEACGHVIVEIDGVQESYSVEEIDGRAIIDGDIIAGDDPQGIAGSVVALKLWPGGIIPYEVDPRVNRPERIEQAARHWRDMAGIRLVPRSGQRDYVRFFRGSGCYSALGRRGGKQEISIADTCSVGSTIHEIGHTLGLYHEQSRSDRDDHVKIHWLNVQVSKVGNYRKTRFRSLGAYDWGSIMHYGSFYFSRNDKPAMTTRSGALITPNRAALSTGDVAGVRKLYEAERLPAPASGTGPATTTANVNFREGPSTAAGVISVIPRGTVVQRLGGSEAGYLLVAHAGRRGWAYATYVRP